MLSVGIDVIEIERVARVLCRYGERFLERIYTPDELRYCRGRVPELAVRFAAKEAVSKALGTGLFGKWGVNWRDIEVLPDLRGKPHVILRGRAAERAEALGLREWAISLSHSKEFAVAMVVAQG